MSEIVEDLKLSTLEITTGLGINFSATDGYITHHGEGDFVIESEISPIVIKTEGTTGNSNILIQSNGDILMDTPQENCDIILTTTDTGVVVAPGKFEAGTVFQEYQPTTNPPSYGLLVPTGAVIPYAGPLAPATDPPDGWLFCNGASLLRTTYSILYDVIGTTYGSVDGTHFNLPDLRSRLPLGAGAGAGLTARTLATPGGQESITDVPSHDHNLQLNEETAANTVSVTTSGGSTNNGVATGVGTAGVITSINNKTLNVISTGSTSVNVMNPFLVLNYIIKV
jgi:microcystin-dependent protein